MSLFRMNAAAFNEVRANMQKQIEVIQTSVTAEFDKLYDSLERIKQNATEEYKAAIEAWEEEVKAIEDAYQEALESYNQALTAYNAAMSSWSSADPKTRGSKPTAPTPPAKPTLPPIPKLETGNIDQQIANVTATLESTLQVSYEITSMCESLRLMYEATYSAEDIASGKLYNFTFQSLVYGKSFKATSALRSSIKGAENAQKATPGVFGSDTIIVEDFNVLTVTGTDGKPHKYIMETICAPTSYYDKTNTKTVDGVQYEVRDAVNPTYYTRNSYNNFVKIGEECGADALLGLCLYTGVPQADYEAMMKDIGAEPEKYYDKMVFEHMYNEDKSPRWQGSMPSRGYEKYYKAYVTGAMQDSLVWQYDEGTGKWLVGSAVVLYDESTLGANETIYTNGLASDTDGGIPVDMGKVSYTDPDKTAAGYFRDWGNWQEALFSDEVDENGQRMSFSDNGSGMYTYLDEETGLYMVHNPDGEDYYCVALPNGYMDAALAGDGTNQAVNAGYIFNIEVTGTDADGNVVTKTLPCIMSDGKGDGLFPHDHLIEFELNPELGGSTTMEDWAFGDNSGISDARVTKVTSTGVHTIEGDYLRGYQFVGNQIGYDRAEWEERNPLEE